MLGLRGGVDEDIAEITKLAGIQFACSEYVSHATSHIYPQCITSDEPSKSIIVGVPVVADQGFEFGVEGFQVYPGVVLRSFGGFGGGPWGAFGDTGC